MPAKPVPTKKRRRLHLKHVGISTFIVVILAVYVVLAATKPFAELTPNHFTSNLTITTQSSYIPWPNYGQSAFGLSDGTVISTHGDLTPVPIASAAKIVTALAVLQKHPLQPNAQGPTITLGDTDASLYDKYVAEDGSVVPVSSGQKITERQALEAMLLPSANNMADSLAIWAFGSVNAYTSYANDFLKDKGLDSTHIGSDASGFLPDSTSTASDLIKLGSLAMQNAALAQIVGESAATIPTIGIVHNVNALLGSNDIVGIKTGNSDQDGGVFMGAATATVAGKLVTVISAIAGGPSLGQVLTDSANILAVGLTAFAGTTIVHQGAVLGTYHQTNGSALQAVAAKDLSLTILRGNTIKANVRLESVGYTAKAGQIVGSVSVPASEFANAESVPIVLKQPPTKPSLIYRLLHP